MWKTQLQPWQQTLVARIENDLGRSLEIEDMACVQWDTIDKVLRVEAAPLFRELRTKNLISNVFRMRETAR